MTRTVQPVYLHPGMQAEALGEVLTRRGLRPGRPGCPGGQLLHLLPSRHLVPLQVDTRTVRSF
jgi:hypothetical protein